MQGFNHQKSNNKIIESSKSYLRSFWITLPETSSKATENGWLEEDPFILRIAYFQVIQAVNINLKMSFYRLFKWGLIAQ